MAVRYTARGRGCERAADVQKNVERAFYEVDASMSNWSATSEVSRFNGLVPGESMDLSDPLLQVFRDSGRVHALTNGLFDPAIGELIEVWGFGVQTRQSMPAPEEIAAARIASGWNGIELDGSRVRKLRRVKINAGGIAKGFAVDSAAKAMEKHCLEYYVEAGGEIRMRGTWDVDIRHPSRPGDAIAKLSLSNTSLATSGVYANHRTVNGKRYAHIIDPRTGYPRYHAVSVTVAGPSCAIADALATALILADEREMRAIVSRFQGYGVIAFVEAPEGYHVLTAGTVPEFQCTSPAARTIDKATAEARGTTTLLPNCL